MYKRVVEEIPTLCYFDFDDYVVSFLDDRPPMVLKNVFVGSNHIWSGYTDHSPKIEYDGGHTYVKFTVVKLGRISQDPKYFYQLMTAKRLERKICVDGFMSIERLPDYWEYVFDIDEDNAKNANVPTEEELDAKQPVANNFMLLEDNTEGWLYDKETYEKCFGKYEED